MKLIDGARLQDLSLPPDQEAVLLQPFGPVVIRAPYVSNESGKVRSAAERLLALSDEECEALLAKVRDQFGRRHRNFDQIICERWDKVRFALLDADKYDETRRYLIGAFFMSEYTFKSTAYFNPSVVRHPDDKDGDEMKVILSVRAVGEGHISSVAFREGVIKPDGTLEVAEPDGVYERGELSGLRMREGSMTECKIADVNFLHGGPLSSRILFPLTAATSNGIEDLRLVEMDDGSGYYGTYTAYDGRHIASQMLHTEDFETFSLSDMEGDAVGNKGMALFPSKIGGHYAMLGRQDAEKVWLLYSDQLGHWSGGEVLLEPRYEWEFMHMGNCGSPMRTDEGWLILTHGVGPVREYTIGAALLDLDDPSKVIGRTSVPLVGTDDQDRHGYVPNAVYSCGGIVHNDRLIMPFGLADYEVRCVDVGVRDLIDQMEN
ncbi:hypothetical protein [Parvularcula maris]|uniref:Glycosidase n=1 Tax=Parvularcula maris TaxID=2965077 RepID=A0A9X2L7U3_9PROT|nr:hypothetical protein [Parvularcula maris]MCQ8184671.1 hypothetical protein [Parvularcula maris]